MVLWLRDEHYLCLDFVTIVFKLWTIERCRHSSLVPCPQVLLSWSTWSYVIFCLSTVMAKILSQFEAMLYSASALSWPKFSVNLKLCYILHQHCHGQNSQSTWNYVIFCLSTDNRHTRSAGAGRPLYSSTCFYQMALPRGFVWKMSLLRFIFTKKLIAWMIFIS